ncbi:MAG: tail fiber protein [Desulfovibrio sp.]
MTIASEQSKIIYQGNGSTKEFTVPFSYVADADLEVLLRGSDNVERVLAPGSDYVLVRSGESVGGTCVLTQAPEEGAVLAIRRDPPILQETVYEEGVPLSAKSRENALDLLTMIAQSNRERIERALLLPVSSNGGTPVVPNPNPGAVLAWNESGNLTNGPTVAQIGSAASAAATATAASGQALAAREAAMAARTAAEAARDEAEAIAGGEHNSLVARDAVDCHPMAAISGLDAALADKAGVEHAHVLADITDAGTAAGHDVGTGPDEIPTNALVVGIPVGASIIWDGDAPPNGFLERDGAAISRTTYAALFGVIGTRFGVGDGSTTFNLPDNRGEFLRGWDHGRGVDPDRATRTNRGDGTSGDNNGTKQNDEFKSHTHVSGSYGVRYLAEDNRATPIYSSTATTGATGGNETRPRNVNVMYCIRY